MDHLEHPTAELWESRRRWFEERAKEEAGQGGYFVSRQCRALIAEVQSVFCAGAWGAVILLTLAVVDAQLRETELPGFRGDTKQLLEASGANPELDWLRRRRDALLHCGPGQSVMTVDHQWADRTTLEADAHKAVTLMFEAFYFGSCL
jgi:hypothetical protein